MSDRDELAQQLFLSRNGGGSWMGEFEDTFDFAAAQNEADFVMASDWLARVKREAAADAWDKAVKATLDEMAMVPADFDELVRNPYRAAEIREAK